MHCKRSRRNASVVQRLQSCAQCRLLQVEATQPCRRCRRGRRRPLQVRRTRSSGSANCDAPHPPPRRARRRGTAAARDTHNHLEATAERRRHREPPASFGKVVRLPAPIEGRRGRRLTNRRRQRLVRTALHRYHTPESQHLAEHEREARLLADALHSDELTEADEWERRCPRSPPLY